MTTSSAARVLDFPERVGRYQLIAPIGSGGMARVFLARAGGAGGFQRQVAIKLLHPHLREVPEFVTGLLDEARIAARVHHPKVVQIFDVVEDSSGVYLVMEYVEGDTLSGIVRALRPRGQRLPARMGLKILCDALAGLHAAHELRDEHGQPLGLVHRDFSPQNILVGVDGSARLTDFGVVKAAGKIGHTRTGLIKGKVRYMSPEQARARPIDRRSDVWAAGVVAWELFANRALYPTEDDASTLLCLVSEKPPRVSSVWPEAPAEIDEAVATALEPDSRQRCPSADELRRRLLAAAGALGGVADDADVGAFVRDLTESKRAARRAFEAHFHGERTDAKISADGTPTADLTEPTARSLTEESDTIPLGSGPGAGEPVTATATVKTPLSMAPVAQGSGRGRRAWLVLGAVTATTLVAFGVLLAARFHPSQPAASTQPSTSSTSTSGLLPTGTAAGTTAESAPTAEATAPRPASNQVRVMADRPISKLRIGGRLVAISPPESDVTIRLTDQELAARERVEATAKDGARMTLEIDGTAEVIEIDFASAVQRPRRLAPFTPSTPGGTGGGRAPLAPNPYGGKR